MDESKEMIIKNAIKVNWNNDDDSCRD